MRIAWFRPRRSASADDAIAPLLHALGSRHVVDLIHEAQGHDMVWAHHRGVYAINVYELDNTPDAAFMWPYLLRYPGLTLLLNSSLVASRSAALFRERRSERLQEERDFPGAGSWPLLWPALGASRLVVVPHRGSAAALAAEYPAAHVAPVDLVCPGPEQPLPPPAAERFTVGCIEPSPAIRALVERAVARARDIGVTVDVCPAEEAAAVIAGSHLVLALQWPASGRPLSHAVAAMAAGRPTVVFDTIETADWPAWDPQTWQRRDVADPTAPACITLDIRDDEHSLVLCLRRLTTDPVLRAALASGARAWWETHAAPDVAVAAFEQLLETARQTPAPPPGANWPPHLLDDATGLARRTLHEFGFDLDRLDGLTVRSGRDSRGLADARVR